MFMPADKVGADMTLPLCLCAEISGLILPSGLWLPDTFIAGGNDQRASPLETPPKIMFCGGNVIWANGLLSWWGNDMFGTAVAGMASGSMG